MQTTIVPVPVYPRMATRLYLRSIGLGPPPSYYYELQAVDVVTKEREVPNPNYNPGTTDLETGVVTPPAPKLDIDGNEIDQASPTISEVYSETTVAVLKNGNVSMTIEQWDNWPAGPETGDDDYQLDAITANLGLTRA